MPRYNIEHNGKWAAFSTISDGFITEFMDKEDYERWRRKEYGRNCGPVESDNLMTLQQAARAIVLHHQAGMTDIERIEESGLPTDECVALMQYAIKYYGEDEDHDEL